MSYKLQIQHACNYTHAQSAVHKETYFIYMVFYMLIMVWS